MCKINFENYKIDTFDNFIDDNISLINKDKGINMFEGKKIKKLLDEDEYNKIALTKTDILKNLNARFSFFINNEENKNKLDNYLDDYHVNHDISKKDQKKEIEFYVKNFANKNCFYYKDIEEYYKSEILHSMKNKFHNKIANKVAKEVTDDLYDITKTSDSKKNNNI